MDCLAKGVYDMRNISRKRAFALASCMAVVLCQSLSGLAIAASGSYRGSGSYAGNMHGSAGLIKIYVQGAELALGQNNSGNSDPSPDESLPVTDTSEHAGDSRFSIAILPQMELLTAVQTQTTWMDTMGPKNDYGNDYFQAVNEFMQEYKGHEAVKVCQNLLNSGFAYDAPPSFILHLGPLPDLDLVHEYSGYLVRRAGGREKLEEFRLALKALVRESNFLEFLSEWQPQMEKWIAEARNTVNLEKVVGWWEEFAGFSAAGEYHIILCPAAFGGSYGPRVYDEARSQWVSYNVACAHPGKGAPSFGDRLEWLSIHEIGHSFVNPSLEPFGAEFESIYPLYNKVRSKMKKQAYGNVATFLNEQVLRAAHAIAEGELYGRESREESIRREESQGFQWTSFVVEQLEDYMSSRNKYPKFTDFAPVLLESLAQEASVVRSQTAVKRALLWGAVGLGAVVLFLTYRHRKAQDMNRG